MVDAALRGQSGRRRFLDLAQTQGVRFLLVEVRVSRGVRAFGPASDFWWLQQRRPPRVSGPTGRDLGGLIPTVGRAQPGGGRRHPAGRKFGVGAGPPQRVGLWRLS
ncbi:hypothetical protein DFAR_30009 [Desulfarculales bacterium]